MTERYLAAQHHNLHTGKKNNRWLLEGYSDTLGNELNELFQIRTLFFKSFRKYWKSPETFVWCIFSVCMHLYAKNFVPKRGWRSFNFQKKIIRSCYTIWGKKKQEKKHTLSLYIYLSNVPQTFAAFSTLKVGRVLDMYFCFGLQFLISH